MRFYRIYNVFRCGLSDTFPFLTHECVHSTGIGMDSSETVGVFMKIADK